MKSKTLTQHDTQLDVVEDEQIAHLAGFFDGVGTATVTVVKDSDYKIGYTLRPTIRVYRANKDDPILGKLVAYCEDEGVKFSVIEQDNDTQTTVEFVIKGPESVERFLTPLLRYLVSNYFDAEMMLGEILPALENGEHRNKNQFYQLMEVVDQLSNNRKYTQQYFKEEWSISQ